MESRSKKQKKRFEIIHIDSINASNFSSNYRDFGLIDSGTYGSVRKVQNRKNQAFAAKFIKIRPDYEEYIEWEMTILQNINHPNVMKAEKDYYIRQNVEPPNEIIIITELAE